MDLPWLFTAALIVDIEPYDGFDVICNSRCLLGLTARYAFVRMPLMPLVMTLTRDARGVLVTPEGVSLHLYPGTVDERPAMMFGSPLQRELGRLVLPVMIDVDTNQARAIRRVSKGMYAVTGFETDLKRVARSQFAVSKSRSLFNTNPNNDHD